MSAHDDAAENRAVDRLVETDRTTEVGGQFGADDVAQMVIERNGRGDIHDHHVEGLLRRCLVGGGDAAEQLDVAAFGHDGNHRDNLGGKTGEGVLDERRLALCRDVGVLQELTHLGRLGDCLTGALDVFDILEGTTRLLRGGEEALGICCHFLLDQHAISWH